MNCSTVFLLLSGHHYGEDDTCHPSYGDLVFTPAGLTFLLNMLAFIGHTQFWYITDLSFSGGVKHYRIVRFDVSL